MRQKPTPRRKVGRPPAGLRHGEMVKQYPQLSVRVPPEARLKLAALSMVRGIPQWRLVMNAVDCYVSAQTPEVRQLIERIVNVKSARALRQAASTAADEG